MKGQAIAIGMALSVSMITIYAGFDRTIALTFNVMDHSDVTVNFTHAASEAAIVELGRMQGAILVESVRYVPTALHHRLASHRSVITRLAPNGRLSRALDAELADIFLEGGGIVLSTALATKLNIRPGDRMTVEMRKGSQPALQIPVTAVAEHLLGAPAYMEIWPPSTATCASPTASRGPICR